MNVLIDTSPLHNGNARRGVGRYTRELVAALKQQSGDVHVFTSDEDHPTPDLVHYPFFDLFFATLPLVRSHKTIVTIHDVIPLVFSTHYPSGVRGKINLARQRIALSSVSHVITDSECSRRDIHQHLGIHLDRVTSIPLAVSSDLVRPTPKTIETIRHQLNVPKHYALYVGDINFNKNVPFLIRAMQKVHTLQLVLVGSQMMNTAIPEGKAIEQAIAESGMQDRVIRLTSIENNEQLAALYSGATVYIQPSLYEGFGLPALEAMRCKTPVVSSIGGSLKEVVGDGALLFHPHQEEECVAAVKRVIGLSESDRAAMVARSYKHEQTFTWERTARETIALYEKVMRY